VKVDRSSRQQSEGTFPAAACSRAKLEDKMNKPDDPREEAEKAKKKPGGQQHANPPKKTDNNNPERNPRDQKGRGGSK
jgi:hypothetical protein